MRVDKTVRRETGYIALWVVLLSAVTQAVFLIGGWWTWKVLCGNLLSAAAGIGNFFLLGLTVQKAVTLEEKNAAALMRSSKTVRFLLLALVAALGAVFLNLWSSIIPLIYPSIAIKLRPIFNKHDTNKP